jgi:hypothetical protein
MTGYRDDAVRMRDGNAAHHKGAGLFSCPSILCHGPGRHRYLLFHFARILIFAQALERWMTDAATARAEAPGNHHVVTYHVEPEGKRTKVILTQSNLLGGVTPADMEKRAEYEKNWAMVLENLDKVMGSTS